MIFLDHQILSIFLAIFVAGLFVCFVGDAAQQIYSFRGGKAQNFMNVKGATDLFLTRSFRFGDSIARCANVVLFAKEKSFQTKFIQPRMWLPYRIIGRTECKGEVSFSHRNDVSYGIISGLALEFWGNLTLIAR